MSSGRIKFMVVVVALWLSSAPLARAQSSRQAIDWALPRLVKIYGAGGLQNLETYGSGFLVSAEGHVVTAWNHLLDGDNATVVLSDGRRFAARVVGAEPRLDLAVLRLEQLDSAVPYVDLDAAKDVPPGTRILGMSNMFNVAVGDEAVSVIRGVIAGHTRLPVRRGVFESSYDVPVYIVDAVTNNSGSAGGLIVTYGGVPVAMIGKQLKSAETNTWINYSLPLTELREPIREIITGKFQPSEEEPEPKLNPRRYSTRDFGLVMVPDVLPRTPAYIDAVRPNSAAANSDLRPDDLILFVNDDAIQSTRMLNEKLGLLEAGDTVRLVVRRGDALLSVEWIAEKKPDERETP